MEAGCRDAQRRLTPTDARRLSEPEYRRGWNAFQEAPQAVISPSFDCSNAHEQVDRLICSLPNLAKLDAEVAASYNAAINRDPTRASYIKARQVDWWRARQECTKSPAPAACVENAFRSRIFELSSITTTTPRISEPAPPIPTNFLAPPLHQDFAEGGISMSENEGTFSNLSPFSLSGGSSNSAAENAAIVFKLVLIVIGGWTLYTKYKRHKRFQNNLKLAFAVAREEINRQSTALRIRRL